MYAQHRRRLFTGAALMVALVTIGCSAPDERTSWLERATGRPTERPASAFPLLQRRDLRLPELRPGTCSSSDPLDPGRFSGAIHLPGIPAEAGLGPGVDLESLTRGPIYTVFPAIPRALDLFPPEIDGWRRATVLVVSRSSYRGPVLLRGHQLDGLAPIAFGRAGGKEWELRLPAGSWDERRTPLRVWRRTVRPREGWRVAVSTMLLRRGGCYGFQIDGLTFSHVIRFYAIWQE
jgi:hypothetical protein